MLRFGALFVLAVVAMALLACLTLMLATALPPLQPVGSLLAAPLALAGAVLFPAVLPVGRFAEAQAPVKLLPYGAGYDRITEAVTTEFRALIDLVRQALREKLKLTPGMGDYYVDVQGIWADKAVVLINGRLYSYPYTVGADNAVALGEGTEVVASFTPVKEALASQPGDFRVLEAKDGGVDIEVTVIRAGLSGNGNYYSDAALKTLVPLVEAARVFVKSDELHLKGGGKDVGNLIGGLFGAQFVAGLTPDTGRVTATFRAISATEPAVVKMVEAIRRGMQGLMGLSIDASATVRKVQRDGKAVREAVRFVQLKSVDLIVEPGAGGGLDRLAEAAADPTNLFDPTQPAGEEPMFKKTLLLAAVAALATTGTVALTEAAASPQVFAALQAGCATHQVDVAQVLQLVDAGPDEATVTAGVTRLVEAAKAARLAEAQGSRGASGATGDDRPLTQADLAMFRVRQAAATKVAGCNLPGPAKERLQAQLDGMERFTEAQVDELIAGERAYLARMTESGTVRLGDGSRLEVQDRSIVIKDMLDAFFDPKHKDHRTHGSFKECYIEITGDRHVTGRLNDCDMPRLRESLGAAVDFREAINSSTFSNVLGDSITRRMLAYIGQRTDLQTWRRVASVTRVADFRTQERTQMGGYANLPAVAQGAAYTVLTSPGDLKATYAVTKRGGLETLTLEAIKNDDVGAIRRIPTELGLAAANTLYEFVFDFFRTNPTIYDAAALYTAPRGNLFTAAFSAAQWQAHRLAMQKQVRLSSAKRRGVTPRHLLVPVDLQEAAFNAFVRDQNLDATFVQASVPQVTVVDYWTDVNDWCTVSDQTELPVLEIGFLDGREDPELFVQDTPNVGSLFSNDQVTWKIRHIYSGAILPEGEKGTTKAVVP